MRLSAKLLTLLSCTVAVQAQESLTLPDPEGTPTKITVEMFKGKWVLVEAGALHVGDED